MKLNVGIITVSVGFVVCGCVGSNNNVTTNSPNSGSTITSQTALYQIRSPHEEAAKKKFKEEDKARSKKFLDTKPAHNEPSGDHAVKSLKELLSMLPSHIYERYDEHDGMLEYNSSKFSREDLDKGVIAKIDPADPSKICLNTHIDQRDYSLAKKDSAILLIAKQKFDMEWKKFAVSSSPNMSPEKRTVLLDSYKEFIEKVMADDKNPTNGGGTSARDFFFGAGSAFHKLTDSSELTHILIEQNLKVVQEGMAKAITYHRDMASVKGSAFLSSRFPEVNKLTTELYFEPHGKDSPHLTDSTIPKLLIDQLEYIMNAFNVSSSSFDTLFTKYISSQRLGMYIAASSELTDKLNVQATEKAYSALGKEGKSAAKDIQEVIKSGVGGSNVQAAILASRLRHAGLQVEIIKAIKTVSLMMVRVTMSDGTKFYLNPWSGHILPENRFNEYYPEFKQYIVTVLNSTAISKDDPSYKIIATGSIGSFYVLDANWGIKIFSKTINDEYHGRLISATNNAKGFNRYYGNGSAYVSLDSIQDDQVMKVVSNRLLLIPGTSLDNVENVEDIGKIKFLYQNTPIVNELAEKLTINGIYHNDLNVGNIMFDPKTNQFNIIDFDSASFTEVRNDGVVVQLTPGQKETMRININRVFKEFLRMHP